MYRAVKFYQMYESDGTSLSALHSDRATFLDFVSQTDTAKELKAIADKLGLPYHKKSVEVTDVPDHLDDMPHTTRVIELVERTKVKWREKSCPTYLAWLKVPDVDGLKLRVNVSDEVSEDEFDEFRTYSKDDQFGVDTFGTDENGKVVIAISTHAFYAIGPTLGYSVKAMCALYGGTESNLTYDDQVFICSGCDTVQEDSDGYNNRFEWVNDEIYGVRCGCADQQK